MLLALLGYIIVICPYAPITPTLNWLHTVTMSKKGKKDIFIKWICDLNEACDLAKRWLLKIIA